MKNIPWDQLRALPSLAEREERYVRRVMRLCNGDVIVAAKVLKIGRATLYRKVRELQIETQGQRVERERVERWLAVERLGAP